MSAAGEQSPRRVGHWILSSSGAQPLFLENIVRALALPSGETIRFRYEEEIVAPRFRELMAAAWAGQSSLVVGNTAYLSYLDNRDKSVAPKVYPVREAQILAIKVFGTSYIIDMKLERVVDWSVDPDLNETMSKSALDHLPDWPSAEEKLAMRLDYAGYWVAGTAPRDRRLFRSYSASSRSHIKAFENTAKKLAMTSDFHDGKRIFANIVGLRDAKSNALVVQSELRV